MASQNKIVEMIFAIKTIYPYYAKETDVETLVKTWCVMLRDVSDEVADAALYAAMRVCKVPPTPADIFEQIKAMRSANEPTPEELWDVYYKACIETMKQLPMFEYTYIDHTGKSQGQQAREAVDAIWKGLPEPIKRYLSGKGELMRVARSLRIDDATFEKQRFIKALPTIDKRSEYEALVSPETRMLLESL